MRLRISFEKTDAMRFTGHLDLHRTWERTLRRAGLPLAYSQGFNPHPKINLASALPLGFTSQDELVDIWLEDELPLDEVQASLLRAAPPGIHITRIIPIDDRTPTPQTLLEASDFLVTFLDPVPDLEAHVRALVNAGQLPRQRRGKPYDLRPLIQAIELLPPDPAGHQQLTLRLTAREGATGRPEEVISALGTDPTAARVHRLRLVFREAEQKPAASGDSPISNEAGDIKI